VTAGKNLAVTEARTARVRLGVGLDAPLPDVLRLIEDVGGVLVTVKPLPDGVAGAYGKKKGRGFIFVNSRDSAVRRRFTLAHEFGHHSLGHRGVVDRYEDLAKPKRPEEIEANYFASEFLAPMQAVRNWVDVRPVRDIDLRTVVELAVFFGISATAALIRLEEAGLVSAALRRELDGLIDAGAHTRLQASLGLKDVEDSLAMSRIDSTGSRVPAVAFNRAARAYEVGLSKPERLAGYLGMSQEVLEGEFARLGLTPPTLDEEDDA
jgi:Zn-dependent peptidase ImmA (M78 family)